MLNVYEYHDAPESLHNYENSWKYQPNMAPGFLAKYPDRKDVEKVVLSSAATILKYVSITKKPYPAGLQVLMASKYADLSLLAYAQSIGQRVPEIERVLLSSEYKLTDYAKTVIKGPWKEAESVIAKDSGERRVYVNTVLDGDWSKFDKGQFDSDSGWQELMTRIIEYIVTDINDNAWADEDANDHDEDYEPWEEIIIVCKKESAKSLRIVRQYERSGSKVVGYINKISDHEVACKDAERNTVHTVSIADDDGDIQSNISHYVYTTLLAA